MRVSSVLAPGNQNCVSAAEQATPWRPRPVPAVTSVVCCAVQPDAKRPSAVPTSAGASAPSASAVTGVPGSLSWRTGLPPWSSFAEPLPPFSLSSSAEASSPSFSSSSSAEASSSGTVCRAADRSTAVPLSSAPSVTGVNEV